MNWQGQTDRVFSITHLYLSLNKCVLQLKWDMLNSFVSNCLRKILDIHWNDFAESVEIHQHSRELFTSKVI